MISLDSFIQRVKKEDIHMRGMMVMQHGKEVASHYWIFEERRNIHSASKTFCAMAVGVAVSEGYFKLEDRVAQYFPDKLPENPSKWLLELKVENLLTMTAGFSESIEETFRYLTEEDVLKKYFAREVTSIPGTHYQYDTGNPYVLAALIQRTTGISLRSYAHLKFMKQIGIINAPWPDCLQGITNGGSALMLTTKEMALFGQLLLQKGKWNDEQLIPADYIEKASSWLVTADPQEARPPRGYGYLTWSGIWQDKYPKSYYASGSWGRYIIVIPELDAVVVLNPHEESMAKQMQLEEILEEVLSQL